MRDPIRISLIAIKGRECLCFPMEQHRSIIYNDFVITNKKPQPEIDEKNSAVKTVEVNKKTTDLIDQLKGAGLVDNYNLFQKTYAKIIEDNLSVDEVLKKVQIKFSQIRISQTRNRAIAHFQKFMEAKQPIKK